MSLWKIYKLHEMIIIGVNSNTDWVQLVSWRLHKFLIICFSASSSAVNPFIYCTQIKELKKDIKAMFRIQALTIRFLAQWVHLFIERILLC